MKIKHTFILFIALLSMNTILAQEVKQQMEEYVDQLVKNEQFSGNILVTKGKKVIYATHRGYANYNMNIKNTPATRFRIGSITKQFTAFTVLFLVEHGDMKLTDHIADYIPNYPKPYANQITIHHLLTHTSGIPNYTDDESIFGNRACLEGSTDEFIHNFWDKPLDFAPGTKFSYSNSGYYLLGVIIDLIRKHTYEEVLEKYIDVAEMQNTGLERYRAVIPNMSTGYSAIGKSPKKANFIKVGLAAYTAGAMYSTTMDLFNWHLFLNNQELVSQELMTKYFTPEKDNYAYGWVITEWDGHKVQWHNGGIDGFVSFIGRFPDDDLFITILSNYEGAPIDKMGKDLSKIALGGIVALPKMPNKANIDPAIYDQYVGTFNLMPGFDLVITREDNHLMLQASGQDKFEIYPESKTLFFLKVVDAKVEFIKGANGKFDEIILHQNGEQKGTRVK